MYSCRARKPFYFNTVTGIGQWEPPLAAGKRSGPYSMFVYTDADTNGAEDEGDIGLGVAVDSPGVHQQRADLHEAADQASGSQQSIILGTAAAVRAPQLAVLCLWRAPQRHHRSLRQRHSRRSHSRCPHRRSVRNESARQRLSRRQRARRMMQQRQTRH